MGPLLTVMVLAAGLEPYPQAGAGPNAPDDDEIHLEREIVAAPNPIEAGVSGGAVIGPGLLRGLTSGVHAGFQFQNGFAPDVEVAMVQWTFATGFDVMPGFRLAEVSGRIRPYLDFHLGTRIFPAQRGGLFNGIGAGISASTGVEVMITSRVGIGVHAAVDAMFPTVVSWADLGGGLAVRL